ncbi:MAG TPA: hypothetical protein VFB37_09930 [Steroidobacteraceae bacterium]|nr:hypothetical protein [Steroidobacteraceae bacterium]
MVRSSKQNWQVGSRVRVGFLNLVIRAAIATPGDARPDTYVLSNAAGDKLYAFTPHHGCERISMHEARELLETAQAQAARVAQQALREAARRSQAAAAHDALFAEVA